MRFRVVPNDERVPREGRNRGYLWTDNWNDWWEFRTLYVLTVYDAEGERHDLGGVKIGQFDWDEEQRRPRIPRNFDDLTEDFFSLGQDVSYYEELIELGDDTATEILSALNDVAHNDELFQRAKEERVMGVSLMRSVALRTITGQFRRVIQGGARLTEYRFRYRGPIQLDDTFEPVEFEFAVEPESRPPTNIQVIIGRNGVGKSFMLNAMSRALVYPNRDIEGDGSFFDPDEEVDEDFESPFSNVLSITFSAFDDFALMGEKRNALRGVRYTNVGLRKRIKDEDDAWQTVTRDPKELASVFTDSAKVCAVGERAERWQRALNTLESDPIFEEAEVARLTEVERKKFARTAGSIYRRLSSGHKIVLLTITKLVEKVEERTLVLIDEPEAHLHPPLLSAFVRALSDLLVHRNGVALVATHSPVVLQEVPRECAWKLIRHGGGARVERPRVETFAEHVGLLTHEVFGLEVTRSGFHKMLTGAVEPDDDFEDVVDKFDNKIGSEGRALISSLIAVRDAEDVEE